MNLKTFARRALVVVAVTTSLAAAGNAHADNSAVVPAPRSGSVLATAAAPTAPRSPTATPRNTAVKLAWLTPSSNGGAKINKYRVQRATSAKGPWKTIATPTVRRYRVTGLTNGKRYYFRIAAHNAAGWSTPSKVISAVPRTVPTAPRSPTATPGNTTVKLSWLRPSSNGGAKINKYRVQRATSKSGPWKTIATPTTRYHTASGLTNGKRYYFRIRAHNSVGWSKPSTAVKAVPHTVPNAPLSLVATPGNSSVKLNWDPPAWSGGAKVNKYMVQHAALGSWHNLTSTTELTYTATQLYNGSPYDFRVLAHNPAGWGTPSLPVQAVPFTNPAAPLKLTATSGKDWINLTWNPPLGDGGRPIDSYLVYRATSLDGTYSYVKYTQNLSYLETPLAAGTAYYYKVFACNPAGCGPSSNVVSANVPTLPSKPACGATQLYGPGSDWVRVQLTPPADNGGAPILDYKVHIDYDKVYATAQPAGNATTFDIYMPYDISGQPYNGHYSYNVFCAARNAAGVGPEHGSNFWMEP
jgi:predicted phage tail protein